MAAAILGLRVVTPTRHRHYSDSSPLESCLGTMDDETSRAIRKRTRSPSPTYSIDSEDAEGSTSTSQLSAHVLKHHKLDLESFASSSISSNKYICTSSPVCDSKPLELPSLDAIQAHHIKCHLHICKATMYFSIDVPGKGRDISCWHGRVCGKVFPDERLLSLHHAECHDVATKRRQNEGSKIFGCLLPLDQCDKVCLTAKSRRLHMINKHHYPKQYYFGIVLHGLNRLLHNEGPGASMIRPVPPDVQSTRILGPGSRSPLPYPKTQTQPTEVDELSDMLAQSSLAFVPRKVKSRSQKSASMAVDG